MSCDIRWDSSETSSFLSWTKELLYDSLNSGKRPHILSSEINIENLYFGENSPSFEILEIGDLANDKFRGIFKLKYHGDSQIRLSTSIQANLLNIYEETNQESGSTFTLPKFPLASQPFSIPLFVNLSEIRLSGIIVVVFSKTKGLTLVFKNDPLENIKVSSSFDNVQVIERFLQNKIENQIRDLFRDILPGVLHKVSQRWTTTNIISQLHSKLNEHQQESKSLEKVSIFDINSSEPEISPVNMLKLSTLTKSRLSFRLSVPPFPEVMERPSLFKYHEDLKNNLNRGIGGKNIPIEIITSNSGFKLENTLSQLTKIQSKLYFNEKKKNGLKRRSIKMNRKAKTAEIAESTIISDNITLVEEETKDKVKEEEAQPPQTEVLIAEEVNDSKEAVLLKDDPLFRQPIPKLQYQQQPLLIEKFQFNNPITTSLNKLNFNRRSSSPRKSQVNLMSNVGIGNLYNSMWNDAPPPYQHA